jgi:c-di-GMP-binding flagellar brake protein YcgR
VTVRRRRGERRRFVRIAEQLVVSCTPRVEKDDQFDGRTLNFSAGGVLLISPTILPIGQSVDLVLRVPDDDSGLRLDARVIRVRSLSDTHHEIAVEFTGGDTSSQRALQVLLEERTGALGIDPTEPIPA